MEQNYNFPTQGELVRFAFNAFGVLPRKGDHESDFSETDKKRIQKLLTRLSNEEGLLLDNFDVARSELGGLLSAHLSHKGHLNLMMNVVDSLYAEYNSMITEEGTYETKLNSIAYYLLTRAMPIVVKMGSLNWIASQHERRFTTLPSYYELLLPSLEDEVITAWPLGKTMRWIYGQFGVSQRQFHLGSDCSETEAFRGEMSLESAQKWSQGKSLPSAPALIHNFMSALDRNPALRVAHPELVESLPFILICARLATFVGQTLLKRYDKHLLRLVSDNIKRLAFLFRSDVQEFEQEICREVRVSSIEQVSHEELILGLTDFSLFVNGKAKEARETLAKLHEADAEHSFKPPVMEALKSRYGEYIIWSELLKFHNSDIFCPSEAFLRTLDEGYRLLKAFSKDEDVIIEYEKLVESNSMSEQLGWMKAWVRASYEFRVNGPEAALEFYRRAMQQAKYRAGKFQYRLVNRYLEMCAKTNRKKEFKKGLEWANYLNIKIRWLRDDEQTEAAIDLAMAFLERADYPEA